MVTRRKFKRKDGTVVRGTFVKPKFFRDKPKVDLDFHTKSRRGPKGQLRGRMGGKSYMEKVPVIRTSEGEIAGRAKKMSPPYPKHYTIFSRINNRTRSKSIPVGHY